MSSKKQTPEGKFLIHRNEQHVADEQARHKQGILAIQKLVDTAKRIHPPIKLTHQTLAMLIGNSVLTVRKEMADTLIARVGLPVSPQRALDMIQIDDEAQRELFSAQAQAKQFTGTSGRFPVILDEHIVIDEETAAVRLAEGHDELIRESLSIYAQNERQQEAYKLAEQAADILNRLRELHAEPLELMHYARNEPCKVVGQRIVSLVK
jgi:hypothetical protein